MNKNAVLVGRGGFEAKMSSVTLYFKGVQRHAPQTLQFTFIHYPKPVWDSKPINKVLNPFKTKVSSTSRPNNDPN